MATNLTLEGVSVDKIYQDAVESGLKHADAAILVSSWIFENFGKSKRHFSYQQVFEESDPECVAQFERSFEHLDWIDGESIVQAETTAGEDGFNRRFHEVESDLDAIRADLDKAFECQSIARAQIHKRFDELRAEINRINNDIHNCCHTERFRYRIPEYEAPTYGGLIDTGMYLGNAKINDKYVALWQTRQGMMMLPTVYSVGTDFVSDGRVQRSGNLARYFAENPRVREAFSQGTVTKEALIERFGNETLANGKSLRSNLETLPRGARFQNIDALVDDIAEREASALRTREGVEAAVSDAFGMDLALESLKDAPVERLGFLPSNARRALAAIEVDSVGKLAAANPAVIQRNLKREGINVAEGDIAEWTGVAKTLANIR